MTDQFNQQAKTEGADVAAEPSNDGIPNLWHDVFVEQPLPWRRFVQSVGLHSGALILIGVASASWVRQQKILEHAAFDRSSVITYSPQEYLPPLDTGATQPAKARRGDPEYARQAILSVPREANSPAQTVVVPPDVALNKDVPMPNIVATGAILPAVPLDATRSNPSRMVVPDAQVIAPAPDVQMARDRVVNAAMKSDVIAPPPEVAIKNSRDMAGPDASVIAPPPDITRSSKGRAGPLNVALGPSTVVAPSPQLALDEQHLARRGGGRMAGGSVQPVAPAPAVSSAQSGNSGGRLVALGIHPVAPSGPVPVPSGNRRGAFEANPQGRVGASGAPHTTGANQNALSSGNSSSLPSGLHVGAADSASQAGREVASLSSSKSNSNKGARSVSEIADDKITDEDREVFRGKRPYAMTLNMPNLNSSTGSWEIRFAEVGSGGKAGDLLAPVATEKSDPGYPLELIRSNVHGMVTLYAVIGADGNVASIRVLNSPDDRLDAFAEKALSRCKFAPAERGGKPVALEAVVRIPFKVRRNF